MDLNNLKVELFPHIAQQGTALGVVDVEFDQCFVQCNDKRVGIYCGRKNWPNRYLSFTEPFPAVLQAAIAKEVAKQTGGVSNYGAPPPEEHEVVDDE